MKTLEDQVERLVQVFELIGKPARGKTCPAIDGILEDTTVRGGRAPDAYRRRFRELIPRSQPSVARRLTPT